MSIKLIVGLGNPGSKYERTRHNVGFDFVNYLANKSNVSWQNKARFQGEYAKINVANTDVHLLKPQTFMNLSGQSVSALAKYFGIHANEVVVVHDELDLNPGTVRLKLSGGHGGHNGLRDIERHLGTKEYLRIRIGIGHPGNASQVSNYVLKSASVQEQIEIENTILRTVDQLENIIKGNNAQVMNTLH